MILASISFLPELEKTEPLPALKSGLSSSDRTAFSTASIAVPPFFKISSPASIAFFNPSVYNCSFSAVIEDFNIVPAPP